MKMYDRNGLQLTAQSNTLNSYRLTAVSLKVKKYSAYARADRTKGNLEWTMFSIGLFNDPRDAAFVAGEFEKTYTKEQIRQMINDETFRETCNEFKTGLDIPVWQFPAEGLLIHDILSDYKYDRNYVADAKEALREVIKTFKLQVPAMSAIAALVAKVETIYSTGKTYREAAKIAMEMN